MDYQTKLRKEKRLKRERWLDRHENDPYYFKLRKTPPEIFEIDKGTEFHIYAGERDDPATQALIDSLTDVKWNFAR